MLKSTDPEIFHAIAKENQRQFDEIELIASENYTSKAVMEAQGSIMTNKYAEGYPHKRYYAGCQYVDLAEELAISRLKKLFSAEYANVQPHSGSQANQAVYLALLKPGDTILGMSLDCGGHLTHGAKPNLSGKWFNPIHYGVSKTTHRIDYNEIRDKAKKYRPQLIIAGYSAYSRELDFKQFREIADEVGAYFMADIAHMAGLIAAGYHPNPMPYADVVTSTTHKTLRGPRGGIIMSNNEDIAKKMNSAVFPGLQGGPLMHVIAAKAVAFQEALSSEYKTYISQTISNARALSDILMKRNIDIVTGGTDNHIVMVDVRNRKISGKDAEHALSQYNITCNKNTVPFDNKSPFVTSGLRLGSPASTTRGFKEKEFVEIGTIIADILDNLETESQISNDLSSNIYHKIANLCNKFQIY